MLERKCACYDAYMSRCFICITVSFVAVWRDWDLGRDEKLAKFMTQIAETIVKNAQTPRTLQIRVKVLDEALDVNISFPLLKGLLIHHPINSPRSKRWIPTRERDGS